MPKKTPVEQVRAIVEKHGYFFTRYTEYINYDTPMRLYDAQLGRDVVLTLRDIKYRIKIGRPEFDIYNVLNEHPQNVMLQQQAQTGYQRFVNKLKSYNKFAWLDQDDFESAHIVFRNLCRKLSRKEKFYINFDNGALNPDLLLFILIEAINTVKNRMDKRIKIKITDKDGNVHYYELSYDTIDYFKGLLEDKTQQEINTSENDLFDSQNDWSKVDVFYTDKVTAGGFFPFINKLQSLNFSEFGIFNSIDYNNYKNNCFIEALESSHKFNVEEMNLIKSSIYTRTITLEYIQKICDLMNCDITIRIPNEADSKTSAKIFKSKNTSKRNIVMFLYYDHFMINNDLFLQEYYIAHHEELDAKYHSDETRFDIIDSDGNKKHSKMTIVRLIKLLRKYGLLEEIPEKTQLDIARQYKHFQYQPSEIICEYFRPINIKDKSDKQQDYLNHILKNDGYYMFGEHIADKEQLETLYSNLQKLIDSLGVRVRVRNYTKFSELMTKIMFEYGCFEDVYELAQPMANVIREQLVFPKPHTTDGNKFYSNKRLYYVDLNSAYLSVIEGIPTGKCDENGCFEGSLNTKIKELIQKLYSLRQTVKYSNQTLAKCLKLLATSCWGSSIKRNRMFKTVRPKDKDTFITSHINFVVEHDESIVKMIKSVSFQYSYPQFAREVLNNYHKKMDEIRSLCKIYYENIDAILIDEDDYEKLCELGYVGNELGKFKIEHIFSEIAIKSSRKFVATLDDGTHLIHCPKKDIDYDEFVNDVKNNKFSNKLFSNKLTV